MKLPKTITGVFIVLAGAGINYIPFVGQVAAPYIMSAGAAMIGVGGIAKVMRKGKGEDVFEHEKQLAQTIKTKMKGKKNEH